MKAVLNIGITAKATAGTDFSIIRKEPGYIISENRVEEFTLPELTEIDGKVALYSDKSLDSITPLTYSLDDINSTLNAYKTLKESGITLPEFSLNLFYKTDDGKLLIMPPGIVTFINNRSPLTEKISNQSKYRHPDLKGEESFLFSIGILLFKITTGNYPIIYSDIEDLRDKMRRKKFIQPRWENIKLSNGSSNLIDDLLNIDKTIKLEETLSRVKSIIDNGIYRGDEDLGNERERNIKLKNRMLRLEEFRAKFIKYRGLILTTTIASLIIISFVGTLIFNTLKPPLTAGFTQSEVIEAYFEAFQLLDPSLIDDTVAKSIRKRDSNEISTRYVTVKMRIQTDPTSRMITPAEWLTFSDEDKGKVDVFGIYNLEIEQLNENGFSISYEKWYTRPASDDPAVEFKTEIYKLIRKQIFTTEETKYSYQIVDMETITEEIEKVW